MENNYRIHTNIINDTVLNVNLKQDFDNLEVLSLKLRQEDAYKLHSSSYGVIIGRVLANDAFGIPNAKISVFIEKEDNEDNEIESLYPYKTVSTRDNAGRRYNLLPDSSDDSCYRIVGTFPQKRLVLDEGTELEIYEKYWKYTTVTNESGDYMIFGVPEGSQNLHLDIDLSDIGMLSQKPRDFEYKGYNINQFDNASQFKESTNLDGLAQIFSQDKGIYVYPFWGDEDNNVAAITRADFQVQYKFEPTCVFMGAIMSDNQSNSIGHKCEPSRFNGYNDQLVAGEGTIEMIRKTVDGLTEEYQVQGNQLINGDGVWCYQIPMNLDYIGTDEYGNIVPVDSPSKGIPTRARVRFRISKLETGDEGFSRHTAKYLVPNNIPFEKNEDHKPLIKNGNDIDKYFEFGSSTPTECYRDLYWNKVYSVKNYIPRLQIAHRNVTKLYSGIRATNLTKDKARVPFNKLRFDTPFSYSLLCLIFEMVVYIIGAINAIIVAIDKILCPPKIFGVRLWCIAKLKCISLAAELTIDQNKIYYPGCDCGSKSVACGGCPKDAPNCIKSGNIDDLDDTIQQKLAEDYDVAKTDFYDDWLNGTLYMPLWRWRKRRKKSFLFGLIHSRAKSEFCTCDKRYSRLKKLFSCSLPYSIKKIDGIEQIHLEDKMKSEKYHKAKEYNRWIRPTQGIIKEFLNKDNLEIYYYTPGTVRDWKTSYKNKTDVPYVRMFATDIILLGSLNENDIDDIPQLFKYLPATTENTPSIATETLTSEKEPEDDTNEASVVTSNKNVGDNDQMSTDEKGTITTTGMDWGKDGGKSNTVKYGDGLFMDLGCWAVKTKPKSCINVERLCELGVSLDTNYELQYGPNPSDSGEILPDGMITKYELDGVEARAMFATLNHVGFIPSSENQIDNKTTGYKSNRFEYLYPTDFDGRLSSSAEAYVQKAYMQKTKDIASRDYQNFRFGSDDTKKWYFYLKNSNGTYHFPVYNNSFYFYFGINPGKTAMDKLNQLFFADCFVNNKYPFSMTVTYKANNNIICSSNTNTMGYILVKTTDIVGPYYVQLFDYNGNEVGKIENLNEDVQYVAFGGYPNQESGTVDLDANDRTIVSKKYGDNKIIGDDIFSNGSYTVRVVDANGRYMEQKAELVQPAASINYDVYDLSTKYYDYQDETGITPISTKKEICDREKQYYGQINVTSVTIDNEVYSIIGVDWKDGGDINGTSDGAVMPNTMDLKGENETKTIQFGLYVDEAYKNVNNCLCDKNDPEQPGDAKFEDGIWKVFIYTPTVYNFKFKEKPENGCVWQDTNKQDSEFGTHMNYTTVQVKNGEEFNLLVNTVPFKFMIGTKYEDRGNYSDKFYPTNINTKGWYQAYDESVYDYDGVHSGQNIFELTKGSNRNMEQWSQFINFDNDIEITNDDFIKVISYKFSNLFNMSESVFMTEVSSQKISVDSAGGSGLILARSLRPLYEDFGQDLNSLYLKKFLYGNEDSITNDGAHPTIVPAETATIPDEKTGLNKPMFSEGSKGGKLSTLFTGKEGSEYIYNYFAQFTKNGGIVSSDKTCKTADGIVFQSIPYKASTYAVKDKYAGIYGICPGETKTVDTPEGKYDKVIDSKNHPYIAVPFIDRRFDYEFEIFTPNNISGDEKSNVWKISGHTYNGIEMAYDDNYQIIGSNEYVSGTNPTRLGEPITSKDAFEYSYETDENHEISSTTTTFNENSKVWRMPYDLIINGCRGLDQNGDFVETGNEKDIKVWFKKEFRSKQDFSKDYYPLKQELSLSGTTSGKSNFDNITFEYTSCSYDITPEYNDSYSALTATTKAGEDVKFTIVGNRVISYTQNDKDYNFEYSTSVSGKALIGKVKNTNIAFHINVSSEDDHNIYVYIPAIVNINKLPIERIKRMPIWDSNRNETILNYLGFSHRVGRFNKSVAYVSTYMATCSSTGGDFKLDTDSLLFKDQNDMYLKADDSLFSNIVFTGNFKLYDDKKFSIMFIRDYMNNKENFMNRHIRVCSITDPIDVGKDLILRIENNNGERIGFSIQCESFDFNNAEYYMECSVRTSDEPSTTSTTTSTTTTTAPTPGTSTSTTTAVTTTTYDGEVITVKSNGYKDVDSNGNPKDDNTIYFDWNTIATHDLASPNATFYAKLENGLILKVPMKFDTKVFADINGFKN